jgi:aryl-alcohol dehydrogenase-like predicted oxidoreductase
VATRRASAVDGIRDWGDRTERGVADIENRNLGRGRVSVPVVGLGTWRRLEAAAVSGRHRELTDAAIAAGIGLFDTSPMYGEAERLLADALDGQRGQVLIADKIWTPSAEEGEVQLARAAAGTAAGST